LVSSTAGSICHELVAAIELDERNLLLLNPKLLLRLFKN
jgi:hypothetical protein